MLQGTQTTPSGSGSPLIPGSTSTTLSSLRPDRGNISSDTPRSTFRPYAEYQRYRKQRESLEVEVARLEERVKALQEELHQVKGKVVSVSELCLIKATIATQVAENNLGKIVDLNDTFTEQLKALNRLKREEQILSKQIANIVARRKDQMEFHSVVSKRLIDTLYEPFQPTLRSPSSTRPQETETKHLDSLLREIQNYPAKNSQVSQVRIIEAFVEATETKIKLREINNQKIHREIDALRADIFGVEKEIAALTCPDIGSVDTSRDVMEAEARNGGFEEAAQQSILEWNNRITAMKGRLQNSRLTPPVQIIKEETEDIESLFDRRDRLKKEVKQLHHAYHSARKKAVSHEAHLKQRIQCLSKKRAKQKEAGAAEDLSFSKKIDTLISRVDLSIAELDEDINPSGLN